MSIPFGFLNIIEPFLLHISSIISPARHIRPILIQDGTVFAKHACFHDINAYFILDPSHIHFGPFLLEDDDPYSHHDNRVAAFQLSDLDMRDFVVLVEQGTVLAKYASSNLADRRVYARLQVRCEEILQRHRQWAVD